MNENFTRIGFPLTNKDPMCFIDFDEQNNIISEYFLKNIVDMNISNTPLEEIISEIYQKGV